jgi:glycosyltransferase involved in cell wall biosynthesis
VDKVLRVAYFPDSFVEVNGVAMTSKKLVNFVRKRGYPFLYVYAGRKTETHREKNLISLSLRRSPLSIPMDESLKYDPLFQRHVSRVRQELENFRPDVIHITGLNDVSIIGAYLAKKLDIALVGSWHTNLHEFAARRLRKKLRFLPDNTRRNIAAFVEERILKGAKLYYKMPHKILAPNRELATMLEEGTGRGTHLMIRGVDTDMFSPEKRTVSDDPMRFGFVGRLQAEKNVRMLVEIEKQMIAAGRRNFEFLIVGEGSEREYLEANMTMATFPGFLSGEQLSEAYANMDVFVFPSDTETFGNVVQEAGASGVPSIVSDQGGPKFIVRDGETGFIAKSQDDFVKYALYLMDDPEKLAEMKAEARKFALTRSWDAVFEGVYKSYQDAKDYFDKKKNRDKVQVQPLAKTS